MATTTARAPVGWLSATLFLALAGGLIGSLFFKERWLWMDEVCSYLLLSDPSLPHANQAVVGAIDANPPLFIDAYWLLGHGISLQPLFLRAVSVLLVATALTLFYRDVVRVLGRPWLIFGVLSVFAAGTYLNFTLATQVRSYALLLLLFWLYFFNSYQLARAPGRPARLVAQVLLGTALAYTHNFGLLYVVVSTGFLLGLAAWGRDRAYLKVLGAQALILALWALGWFANFRVQAQAGQPHSWIPLPTWYSGWRTVGELLPTFSTHFEASRYGQWLPVVRVAGALALLLGLGAGRLRQGYAALLRDPAGLLLVQAAFVAAGTLAAALVASFAIASVFLSRYLYPLHLLFGVGVLYAAVRWVPTRLPVPHRLGLVAAYGLVLALFVAHQNRKTVHFPSGILPDLAPLDPRLPVFYESADYFLPIWYQGIRPGAHVLLDWPVALRAPSLNATVHYHILSSVRGFYHVPAIVPLARFTAANYPHFYVVDEQDLREFDGFIARGQVRVLRQLPTALARHRILECEFVR